jgi:hypothetical protein
VPKEGTKDRERQISAFRTLASRGLNGEAAAAFENVVRSLAKPQPKKKKAANRRASPTSKIRKPKN